MTQEPMQKSTDLWDAWIDLQCPGEEALATLYVIADVMVNNYLIEPKLIKKTDVAAAAGELVLEIKPDILCEDGFLCEVLYAEELQDLNQYKTISVYAGSELIARIEEIELFL